MNRVFCFLRDFSFALAILFSASALAQSTGGAPVVECETAKTSEGLNDGCTAMTHQQQCDMNDALKICKADLANKCECKRGF